MSYQGWACSAWTTDWNFIKSIIPDEAQTFEDVCNKESSIDDIAQTVSMDDELDDNVAKSLENLCTSFLKKTGLDISLGYISFEEVDSDIRGAVWFVGGVEEKTPAGKKYEKNLENLTWVEYG